MKIKYLSYIVLLFTLIISPFFTNAQGDESMVEINHKKTGLIYELINHKGKYYATAINMEDKKDRQLRLICIGSTMQVEWTQIIFHNFEGRENDVKILADNEKLLTFITDKKDNKIVENLIKIDFSGNITGKSIIIFESDNANWVQKYVDGNKIYLIPLKYNKDPYGRVLGVFYKQFKLLNSSLLEYYCFNTKDELIEKKKIQLADKTSLLSNFSFKKGVVYAHDINSKMENEIRLFSLESESSNKISCEKLNMNALAVSDVRNYYHSYIHEPNQITKVDYLKPTFFELKNKENAENAMGKIIVKQFVENGEKKEIEINFSQDLKDKIKLFSKNNGIKKDLALSGFELTQVCQLNNTTYVVILERTANKIVSYEIKPGHGSLPGKATPSYSKDFEYEIITITIDNNGSVLGQDVIERKNEWFGNEKPELLVNKLEDKLILVYGGSKKTAGEKKGLYQTNINNKGEIIEKGLISTSAPLINNYSLISTDITFFDVDNNSMIVHRDDINKEFIHKIILNP